MAEDETHLLYIIT